MRNEATDECHLYLANVPSPRLTPEDVPCAYAARWEVELSHWRQQGLPGREQPCSDRRVLFPPLVRTIRSGKSSSVPFELILPGVGP